MNLLWLNTNESRIETRTLMWTRVAGKTNENRSGRFLRVREKTLTIAEGDRTKVTEYIGEFKDKVVVAGMTPELVVWTTRVAGKDNDETLCPGTHFQ